MKIINSHYIPLAEPHHIIMAPDEKIAEQIGFMSLKLYQEVKEKYFNSMQYQTIDAYIERASVK